MSLLYEVTTKVGEERVKVLEEYIKLHIRPKPKYLPQFVWNKLLKCIFVLKITSKY